MRETLGSKYDRDDLIRVGDFLLNKVERSKYIKKLKQKIGEKFGSEVSTIVQFQFPKIYEGRKANKWEKVRLVDRGSVVYNIEDRSFYLRNMYSYKTRDTQVVIYFVSSGLRENVDKTKELEAFLSVTLRELYKEVSDSVNYRSKGEENVP